jgi:hypothetical protein
MRDKEAVLWLTLTDFLIQVIFFVLFGAVAYATWSAARKDDGEVPPLDPASSNRYAKGAGFSNYVELTDWLTTMVPADQLRGRLKGGTDAANENKRLGAENERLRGELRKALGPQPCPGSIDESGKVVAVAEVVGFDDRLEIGPSTSVFREKVLGVLGRSLDDVAVLSFAEFANAFEPLTQRYPDCRFYVYLDDSRTQLKFSRKAVETAFFFTQKRVGQSATR